MDPVSGEMYVIAFGDTPAENYVGTLDLSTAELTVVSNHARTQWLRDLTFDSTGQLYAVSGNDGDNPNSLFEVDTTTGTLTVKTALSGTQRHAIAFDQSTTVPVELMSFEIE